MKRQVSSFVAVMALSFVAMGQEPKDDDRVEVKVQALEPDEMEIEDLGGLEGALGSFILGVEGQTQDADEKGEHKGKKGQDAGKGRTIEREIDLGNGRKMRIIISTDMIKGDGKDGVRTIVRREGGIKLPEGGMMRRGAIALPEGVGGDRVRVFRGEATRDPHGFRVEALGGNVKEHMERALHAFDRAREEFIRAFHEGAPNGEAREPGTKKGPPAEHRWVIGKRAPEGDDHEAHVVIEKMDAGEAKAKVEAENEAKGEAKVEVKRARLGHLGDLQFLNVAPGAAAKQAREVDELRKEIKELEKMVQEMRDQLQKKKGE